jgi:hypothetical protein
MIERDDGMYGFATNDTLLEIINRGERNSRTLAAWPLRLTIHCSPSTGISTNAQVGVLLCTVYEWVFRF